jgi:hypothetical protein
MSSTGSLMIRNLRAPTDYQKAVMTQDQLLKIAASNDANIAAARKAYRSGIPEPLTEQQTQTPDQIAQDLGRQESDALTNLQQLFRYSEASKIVSDLLGRPDGRDLLFNLNRSFPQIKKDFTAQFNTKLITPTFFEEYLIKYVEVINQTKGLNTGASALFTGKFDALVNNVNDLRALLPLREQFEELDRKLHRTFEELPDQLVSPVIERINALSRTLPTKQELQKIVESENETQSFYILGEIQDLLADLPTKDDIQGILDALSRGEITQQEAFQELNAAVSSVDGRTILNLQELSQSINALGDLLPTQRPPYINPEAIDLSTTRPSIEDLKRYLNGIYRLDPTLFSQPGNSIKQISKNKQTIKAWLITNDTAIQNLLGVGSASSTAVVGEKLTPGKEGREGFGIGYTIKHKKPRKIVNKNIGKGIQVEEQPQYRQLGKYVIHYPQLTDRNILNVKYPSFGRIPQFKPTPISDETKDFIIDLLDTGRVNPRVYDTLPVEERKLFERIATGSGIIHKLKIKKTISNEDKAEQDRFNLLKGEYLAGNNSNAVMKELRRFIVKFMSEGKIHKNEGMNLLMELSI